MRADGNPVFVHHDAATELERIQLVGKGTGSFDEAWLQRLIHEHPRCLPIHDIEPGFGSLISVCRELPTKHGSVDNLLMTADGDIVLAEAKLWRNPQARREVVAQALDYASCLFEMDYTELEAAALRGNFGEGARPASLYERFPQADALDLPSFVDAVNANLRRGRIVILVVGDGIRTEIERLAASLQSHAGFHFTFALVELAVYRAPGESGYIVLPRTLAKTCMIERGIVHIDDKRVSVTLAPLDAGPPTQARTSSITAEQFYEAMAARDPAVPERLRQFLIRLDELGVYPEFKGSLNIKWDPPTGKSINLGYIQKDGQVWTDSVNWSAPTDLSHRYIEDLASAFGGEIEKERLGGNWHVRFHGKGPRVELIADKFDGWFTAVRRFVEDLRKRLAEQG